jgi:hypothetical protein
VVMGKERLSESGGGSGGLGGFGGLSPIDGATTSHGGNREKHLQQQEERNTDGTQHIGESEQR